MLASFTKKGEVGSKEGRDVLQEEVLSLIGEQEMGDRALLYIFFRSMGL